MVGFKIGGCVHHCGVVVDKAGRFIHCLRGRGAQYSHLRDASYLKRIERIWRPVGTPRCGVPGQRSALSLPSNI